MDKSTTVSGHCLPIDYLEMIIGTTAANIIKATDNCFEFFGCEDISIDEDNVVTIIGWQSHQDDYGNYVQGYCEQSIDCGNPEDDDYEYQEDIWGDEVDPEDYCNMLIHKYSDGVTHI